MVCGCRCGLVVKLSRFGTVLSQEISWIFSVKVGELLNKNMWYFGWESGSSIGGDN